MNESHESDDPDLEAMLREVRLAQPSRNLDRRVGAVFRPRWRMFIGPLSGFAAGILVTVAVLRSAPAAGGHREAPAGPATEVKSAAPAPIPALLIESRNVETLGNGEVNGLPVRLERSQSRLVLWRKTPSGVWRAELELPKQTVVRNAQLN